jgi:hypothetical protein
MNTDDSQSELLAGGSLPTGADRPADPLQSLEVRLAHLEAQVYAHAERLAEFDASARARGRRALWLRLILLLAALAAFFAIKTWGAGGGP